MKRFFRLFRRKRRRRSAGPFQKKIAVTVVTALALVLIPSGSASAAPADFDWTDAVKAVSPSAWVTDLISDECGKPGLPPEVYGSGFDGLAARRAKSAAVADQSYYGQYGTAGLYWNWMGTKCTDFSTPVGNQVANLVFNVAKTIDTVTITVYQSAASESLISWLKDAADGLITSIGKALQVGYLTLVVMLGALALIWWGLFKRRATRVTEGTIWMVCAAAAFLLLVNRPQIFTTAGTAVTGATQSVVDAALSPVDTPTLTGGKSEPVPQAVIKGQGGKTVPQAQTICIPSGDGNNPQYKGNWTEAEKNANTMWSVLVCKPWLQGEFGTANPNDRVVQQNADKLLQSQAFKQNQVLSPGGISQSAAESKAQQYLQVADRLHNDKNGNVALFTGQQYIQRIGIAFAALFAAVVAGILILLLSLALIIFKLGFLLLLITGPVFLLIGVHPGWGRVIAVRWVELLLSSLLKQALVAGLLALLLFLYALIMGSGGLTWVMQIVLIALVSFAAFFYRKPFQHLFAAVGTDGLGSRILSNATTSGNAFKSGMAVPAAPARLNRWSLRKTQPMTDAAGATGHPGAMAVAMASRTASGNAAEDDVTGRTAGRITEAGRARAAEDGGQTGVATSRPTTSKRSGTSAPPLNLPTRPGEGGTSRAAAAAAATGTRGGVRPGTPPGGGRPGGSAPASRQGGGSAPVTGTGGVLAGRSGPGSAPRRGDAPPPIRTGRSSGSAPPPRRPSGGGAAPSSPSGTGGGPQRTGGGWFGSSRRRSGGDGPGPNDDGGGGGGGSRRSGGGGGWFGGGGSSRRGRRSGDKRESAPPPRRSESSDNASGPAPWRKRESAPPLWAKPSNPPAPDIPFWTRPDK